MSSKKKTQIKKWLVESAVRASQVEMKKLKQH